MGWDRDRNRNLIDCPPTSGFGPLVACGDEVTLSGSDLEKRWDRSRTAEPHTVLAWRLLKETLFRHFGGWSGPERVVVFQSSELVPGGWMPEGGSEPIRDGSRRYTLSLPEDRLDELRALLGKAANTFDQQAIYLSVRGYVEFIVPGPADGFLE